MASLPERVEAALGDPQATAAARCFTEGRDMVYILKEHGHEVCKVVRLLAPVYTPALYPALTEAERAEREQGRWERVEKLGTRAAFLALEIRRLL